MPIVVNLDMMLAKRKMSLTQLSEQVGISIVNLSILKNGKAEAYRAHTLDQICTVLRCKPGDILDHLDEEEYKKLYQYSGEPQGRVDEAI